MLAGVFVGLNCGAMKLSFFASICFLFVAVPARGAIWFDSKPSLSWQEMMDCEMVVVAHYESHETLNEPKDDRTSGVKEPNGKMVLRVDRVLKGAAKPGETIEVLLEHLYSIQTGATGWDYMRVDKKADGIPKLSYQQQLMNPGSLRPIPIFPDARQLAIYFLPQAARPALAKPGQVHPLLWESEWRKTLQGKPTDVVFRVTQNINKSIKREALEELYARRDPASLERLFALIDGKRNAQKLGVGIGGFLTLRKYSAPSATATAMFTIARAKRTYLQSWRALIPNAPGATSRAFWMRPLQ